MKKTLVFENQFEDFCKYWYEEGYSEAFPTKKPKEWPCVILVEEINNLNGPDCVEYHYVYESDFNFYEEDVD